MFNCSTEKGVFLLFRHNVIQRFWLSGVVAWWKPPILKKTRYIFSISCLFLTLHWFEINTPQTYPKIEVYPWYKIISHKINYFNILLIKNKHNNNSFLFFSLSFWGHLHWHYCWPYICIASSFRSISIHITIYSYFLYFVGPKNWN